MNMERRFAMVVWGSVCAFGFIIMLMGLVAMAYGADTGGTASATNAESTDSVVAGAKNVAWNKLTPEQKKAVVYHELDKWHDRKMYCNVDQLVKAFKSSPVKAEITFAPLWEIQGVITSIESGILYNSINLGRVRFTVSKNDPALANVEVGTPVAVMSTDCSQTLGIIVCQSRAVMNTTDGYKMTQDEHMYTGTALEQYLVIDAWNSDNVAGYSDGSTLFRRRFR